MITYDFQAAFDGMTHSHVIDSAAELGLREPLLRLLSNYLSERKLVIKWNEARSYEVHAKGGSGQGTILSTTIFTISVNGLLKNLRKEFQKQVSQKFISQCRIFVDDLTTLRPFKYFW